VNKSGEGNEEEGGEGEEKRREGEEGGGGEETARSDGCGQSSIIVPMQLGEG
jgi:hypothetical protein